MSLTCSGVPVSLTCSCNKIHETGSDMLFCGGKCERVHSLGKGASHEHRSTKGTVENILEVLWKGEYEV